VVGSISAPGLFEAASHKIPKEHPLRALYLHQPPAPAPLEPALNWTVLHGVRASLELERTHDRERALKASNPEVAPHLAFTDVGGHGYAVVRASADDLEVEFVCVVRPLERSDRPTAARSPTASPTAPGARPPAPRRASSARGSRARCRSPSDGRGPAAAFRGRAPRKGDRSAGRPASPPPWRLMRSTVQEGGILTATRQRRLLG
jgi:alkaline phosphatase D